MGYGKNITVFKLNESTRKGLVFSLQFIEKTGAGEESNVEHPDLELVLTAVMKCAPHEWYSIAVELGFSHGQIVEETSTIATGSGKLQRMVRVKADAVGNQETARLLLEACANIPHPVIGAVRERLQQLCRH